MGAWAHGSFANDDALDWVAMLSRSGSDAISQALSAVPQADDDYLEAPAASAAIAAAEVVAAQAGSPAAKLPDEVSAWVASQPRPTPELIALARRAVRRVLRLSELCDLWAESKKSEAWQGEVSGLLARLC
jgi:Domain of unknown function (DUF4259)